MHITIAERLKPFSHVPGSYFILPGTQLRFHCFPSLVHVEDLSEREPKFVTSLQLNIQGPVTDFTVEQDLEKGSLRIWGHTAKGYMRYCIRALQGDPKKFTVDFEKTPEGFSSSFTEGYTLPSSENLTYSPVSHGRLSLGNNKAQDWSLVERRLDLKEIFPIWLRLGKLIPGKFLSGSQGTGALLEQCVEDRTRIGDKFRDLFLAGFDLGLSPRLQDDKHQGFHLPPLTIQKGISPLALLTRGSELIQDLFVKCEEKTIFVLPTLPVEFHCGRMSHIECNSLGVIDFEWSKKLVRRVIFYAKETADVTFIWQKDVKRFRLRLTEQDRGIVVDVGRPIPVESGKIYYLDRFEK